LTRETLNIIAAAEVIVSNTRTITSTCLFAEKPRPSKEILLEGWSHTQHAFTIETVNVHRHVYAVDAQRRRMEIPRQRAFDIFLIRVCLGGDSTFPPGHWPLKSFSWWCQELPGGLNCTLYFVAHPSILFSEQLVEWRPILPATYRISVDVQLSGFRTRG